MIDRLTGRFKDNEKSLRDVSLRLIMGVGLCTKINTRVSLKTSDVGYVNKLKLLRNDTQITLPLPLISGWALKTNKKLVSFILQYSK